MKNRRDVLGEIIKGYGLKKGAEIGVGTGPTTRYLLGTHPDLEWVAVDHFPADYPIEAGGLIGAPRQQQVRDIFASVLAQYAPRLRWIAAPSVDAANDVEDGSLDIVFIDGDHSYEGCKADILAWRTKLRSGGWLTGHDYNHVQYPGVVQAVNELVLGFTLTDDYVWLTQVPA